MKRRRIREIVAAAVSARTRQRTGRGQTLDVLDPSAELVHEDIVDHLCKPVALPEEDRRG